MPDRPARPPGAEPDDRRLARLARSCRQGQRAEAELELYAWQREPDCPTPAGVLLALLLAQRREHEAALAVIRRVVARHGEVDPAAGQVLLTILVQGGLFDAARRAALDLQAMHGQDRSIGDWLHLIEAPGADRPLTEAAAAVEQLAVELIEQPQVIPSLVAAARAGLAESDRQLLHRALAAAGPDLSDMPAQLLLCQAMTDLALLAGDASDARRWAHRGLRLDPYCASLALALARMDDDAALGPPAAAILARVAQEHPEYPDVQVALIRRELADGHRDRAQQCLRRWQARQPQHPLARLVAREIAA